jgi:hypothetical protein
MGNNSHVASKITGLSQKLAAKIEIIAISYATTTHFLTFQVKTAKIDPSRF